MGGFSGTLGSGLVRSRSSFCASATVFFFLLATGGLYPGPRAMSFLSRRFAPSRRASVPPGNLPRAPRGWDGSLRFAFEVGVAGVHDGTEVQKQALRDRHAWHRQERAHDPEEMLPHQEREDDQDGVNLRGITHD